MKSPASLQLEKFPPDSHQKQRAEFSLDRNQAVLNVALHGIGDDTVLRAAVFDHKDRKFVAFLGLQPTSSQQIDLTPFPQLSHFSIKIQTLVGEKWTDIAKGHRISQSEIDEVYVLDPSSRDIRVDCYALVRTLRGKIIAEYLIPAEKKVSLVLSFSDDDKYQVVYYSFDSKRARRGKPLTSSLAILPSSLRGGEPKDVYTVTDELKYSIRRKVTLSPTMLVAKKTGGGFCVSGYTGAWEDGEEIAECVEFTLGRQQYLFPEPPDKIEIKLPSPIIYLGLPHVGWGHFLTEGLSRIWFAMQNPQIPVLWDTAVLPKYTQSVFDSLGIRNEMYFLTQHSYAEEVIFPFPGIGLGDYVSPDFAEFVGAIPPSPIIPGKRIFLIRAELQEKGAQVAGDGEKRLLELMRENGFEPFAPELHSLSEQLNELSSAEVVVGIEGSAFHTLLLLQGSVNTQYWALSRHRGGSGVFEHIKQAKDLKYDTLNYLQGRYKGHREPIDLDLDALGQDLSRTKGFTENLELLKERVEKPVNSQISFSGHLKNTQVRLSNRERVIYQVNKGLREGNIDAAARALGSYF